MDLHTAWKAVQHHLGRELPAALGRKAAAAWLQEAAGLRFLVVEPRRFLHGRGLLSLAVGSVGGEAWYRTLGFHESGLLEFREGPASDFALDSSGAPLGKALTPDEQMELLTAGPFSAEGLSEVVSKTGDHLGLRIAGKLTGAANDVYSVYQAAAVDAARVAAAQASARLIRGLPDWIAGISRGVPVPRNLDALNFFLDPVDGPCRVQAVLTYPAAAGGLMSGPARRAIDSGKPLAPVLMRAMGMNKAQVNALRSPELARSLCVILDSGRHGWPALEKAMAAMPGKSMPWNRAALDAGAAHPVAWAQLGRSLQKYPATFTLVDGAPWIPGFSDDGDWSDEAPGVQRLATLRDTLTWMQEAILASLPRRFERDRRRAVAWAARAIDAYFDSRKPEQIARLDDELHQMVVALRGKLPTIPTRLPPMLADGASSGIRYRQLDTMEDYAEEGAAMNHCVSTYFSEAIEGRYVAYAIEAPERATLGLWLSISNQGTASEPVWIVRASFDQVRGPGNAAMPQRYHELGAQLAERISGLRLDASVVDGFRLAQTDRSRKENNAWKYPLYETLRERLWQTLPAELAGKAGGFREALAAELEPPRPKRKRPPLTPLDYFLPDEPLPPQFDPSVEAPPVAESPGKDDESRSDT
ncbi:hypothetical protein D0B54_05180 [Solimonas sp. K1W22B-7]|uniref:PcfJ domain-containing protein n=1 Tax=Solimonas sp. K1W22B-7 TaxID=2303331 RepID=UPI000E331F01|nr:PcfJ domain-containing protein [Solimonas sp. K1W22B-7]AXQ28104.1 hypothetical protein D0B54_05180 [Solimonas sp. K1W22B-7]